MTSTNQNLDFDFLLHIALFMSKARALPPLRSAALLQGSAAQLHQLESGKIYEDERIGITSEHKTDDHDSHKRRGFDGLDSRSV